MKRTAMNRIKKRHQQEVEADYPYSDKRVPHIAVRYLFGSCPVFVRSFIEQLSNNYRTSMGYERLDSGAASPGRRGELSDARDPQDGQVQTAMDRSGRVVVIVPCLPPLSFNPLPPLHRGEGYKEGGTVWNHNSL